MLRSPNAQSQEGQVTLVCVLVGKTSNSFSIEISENAKVEDLMQAILHAQRNQLRNIDTNQIDLARAKKDGDTEWVKEVEIPALMSAAEYPTLRAQAKLCYSQLSRTDIGTTDEDAVAQGRGPVHVLVSVSTNGSIGHHAHVARAGGAFVNRLAEIRESTDPKVVLRYMKLDDENMEELATALENRTSDVEELDLQSNEIGDQGIAFLARILGTSKVQRLLLANNNIADAGALELADVLAKTNSLQVLDLHRTHIGDDGAQHIASALKHNNHLQELDVGTCEIKGAGAMALANALKSNSTLTKLNLMGNCIEDRGAKQFKEVLKNENSTLESLVLSKHHVWFWRRWLLPSDKVKYELY